MDAKKIRQRQSQLVTIRQDYEPLWEDIADLVAPRRSNIDFTEVPGKKKGLTIYDGTPRSACQQMADGFYGYLCSPSMLWFRLKMARKGLNENQDVKLYLQDSAEQLYFAFNRSNFYAVAPEFFFDGGSIGTATMYAEEDIGHGKIVFMPRHPGEIYISPNRYGEVDTVFRKYKMTARNAYEEFGDELSEKIKMSAKNAPETEFEFLHAVFPNTDRQSGKEDSINKEFGSVYLEAAGSNDFLRKSGYDILPYFVWRYRVDSGETYGRSPASDAIVEIFGLNQISKTMFTASQLAVEPAYNVPKEMRGKVRIKPRGMNYYEEPTRTITPVNIPASLPAGAAEQDRLGKSIERHFNIEFFMLLSRAAMEGRQLTVPQVMEMQGEKGSMLGAVVGRLNGDFFDRVIDRVFQIETMAGRMPEVPEVLYESGEESIEVEYMGPLAQAQKQLLKTQGILRSMETLGQIATIYPEVRDRVNPDIVVNEIFDSMNFPQDAIVPIDKANEVRRLRAERQQQLQAMQMMGEAADKVPGLSKAVEPNSVLDKVIGGG
jgi:hypothetical protein